MPNTTDNFDIPFLDGTELVRDYPTFSEDLANAVAAGLTAAGNAGIGSNVVQAVKTNQFTSTDSAFTDIPGLEVTITPSSATAKILLIAQVHVSNTAGGRGAHIRFSGGNSSVYVADADGNRARAVSGLGQANSNVFDSTRLMYPGNGVYLDSPNTTSAVTYKIQVGQGNPSGTMTVNRQGNRADDDRDPNGASSLTAIEVKA